MSVKFNNIATKMYKLFDSVAELDKQISPQAIQVLALMYKAGERGISVSEIEQRMDIPKASASRLARRNSMWLTPKQEGYGWGDWVPDSGDFRIKYLVINEKGKEVFEALSELL